MDYEQFKAEYRPVFDALDTTNKPSADFATDVARLKDLAATTEDLAEIGRIAEAAGPSEEAAIMNLNESLYVLSTALQPTDATAPTRST